MHYTPSPPTFWKKNIVDSLFSKFLLKFWNQLNLGNVYNVLSIRELDTLKIIEMLDS